MRRFGVVACFSMLASCGGGGGSSGGNVVVPTPTPTSPAYQSARDFSQYRSVSDFGTRIERFRERRAPAGPWRTVSLGTTTILGGIGFTYYPDPKAYQAVYLNEFQEFRKVEEIPSGRGMNGDQDYRPEDPLPLRRYFRYVESGNSYPYSKLDYAGIVSWSDYTAEVEGDREVWRYHLYGAVTLASDLPKAQKTIYHSRYTPAGSTPNGGYGLTINWATGELTGTARILCSPNEACPGADLGELRLDGQFDGSRRILGAISGSAGYTGTFVGGFYGPRAVEIGIVGDIRHPTRGDNIFILTGKDVFGK